MASLTLLCFHKMEPIYIMNLQKLAVTIENQNIYTWVKVKSEEISIHDICNRASNHPDILDNFSDSKVSKLDCEIKLFDENFSKIQKFSMYVGLRLMHVKVVFLKRIVNEIVEYIRFQALASLSKREDVNMDFIISSEASEDEKYRGPIGFSQDATGTRAGASANPEKVYSGNGRQTLLRLILFYIKFFRAAA
jgi:hypothetical protein